MCASISDAHGYSQVHLNKRLKTKICWDFGPQGFFCFGSGFLWGFLFCVGIVFFFFFYKTRRFHFPAWRPIKDHKKALSTLNKPRLGIAVKAPWTLREQRPGAPSPSAPQENCKRISERGETWGGKVFHVQNSHLGTALGESSGLSTHMELQRFLGAQSQGREEQRAPSSSCGIVAKDCLMVTTLFHSSCFQSAQKPHIIHQGIPTWAKKTLPEPNSHSWQGRAHCEHLHAWN